MAEPATSCPNCAAPLKSGFMGTNALLTDKETALINEFQVFSSEVYCNKCGNDLLNSSQSAALKEVSSINNKIMPLLSAIPMVSIQSPFKWDYDIIGMVTGQSTTGTGVISEFTSSFSDLFGAQSGRFNKKLKAGEEYCAAQLRMQAFSNGGNAVIATDIDYSEVGGDKGMLMVCMAGTAVKLNNIEILGETKVAQLQELEALFSRKETINNLLG